MRKKKDKTCNARLQLQGREKELSMWAGLGQAFARVRSVARPSTDLVES